MADFHDDQWTHPAVILVATDLSDLDRLMPFAVDEASEANARLILLHVLNAGAGLNVDAVGMPYYDTSSAFEFAAKTLESWRAVAHQHQILCDVVVREGNPAQQIIASVRQFQAGRILLGTRSRGKISKLLLGSVAEQVLRSVNLPVITVGPEAHLAVGNSDDKVVLHATTLRETSRPSAALACQMAASQHARLVLLHVSPAAVDSFRSPQFTRPDATAMQELQQLAAETRSGSLCRDALIEVRVVHGHPAIEILATATEMGASLIILGATHRSALQNLTRDRTIYRVLAHARCPVLTLREESTEIPSLPGGRLALRL
jgi:nucleotide-binding universal stress UspA family protein